MIYYIKDSEELLKRMQGINNWIEENVGSIGNANMFEIVSCMIARNNIRRLEGDNPALDHEVERMISLRGNSINDFQSTVPESKTLFEALRGGLVLPDEDSMDLAVKSQSISFFIDNARKRGFSGDITMPLEVQQANALPDFRHDNKSEMADLMECYDSADDRVRSIAFPLVEWAVQNSIDRIKDSIDVVAPTVSEDTYNK